MVIPDPHVPGPVASFSSPPPHSLPCVVVTGRSSLASRMQHNTGSFSSSLNILSLPSFITSSQQLSDLKHLKFLYLPH